MAGGIKNATERPNVGKVNDIPPDTIIVVEVRNSQQHWTEPGGDFQLDKMPHSINASSGDGISGHDPDGFLVGFASGEVWLLSHDIPFATLSRFFALESAGKHSQDELVNYRW